MGLVTNPYGVHLVNVDNGVKEYEDETSGGIISKQIDLFVPIILMYSLTRK